MTQEEKAKAYDELKVKAQELTEDGYIDKLALLDLFPELTESEDEKIRKKIIALFKGQIPSTSEEDNKNFVAWLEKVGNIIKEWGDLKVRYIQDDLQEMVDLKQKTDQGEQKPADKVEQKGMNIVEEDMTPFQKKVFCIIDTTIEEEQGLKQVCDELLRLAHDEIMQKPAWSEDVQEEQVSEELEEAAFDYAEACKYDGGDKLLCVEHFKAGARWQKEQMLSEEKK